MKLQLIKNPVKYLRKNFAVRASSMMYFFRRIPLNRRVPLTGLSVQSRRPVHYREPRINYNNSYYNFNYKFIKGEN